MSDKFKWHGIAAPIQYLIRLCRTLCYGHYEQQMRNEIEAFIKGHVYTSRHDSIFKYIETPYDKPQGSEQMDKVYHTFWSEYLSPHFDAVYKVFESCVTQRNLTDTIENLKALSKVIPYPRFFLYTDTHTHTLYFVD